VPNSTLAERDIFRELCERSDIAVNAWMVLLHNTRLGMANPEATVQNCFGDRYVYSLCPSAPDARRYAVALCKDITDNYPVTGLSLETPGFLPYVHGYHHEFALVRPNRWLDNMLGLCFCPHCVGRRRGRRHRRGAAEAKDGRGRRELSASAFDLPDDMADAFWLADTQDRELSAFLRWRCEVVTSLVAEIRAAVRPDAAVAVIPSVARPTAGAWYEGTDLHALAGDRRDHRSVFLRAKRGACACRSLGCATADGRAPAGSAAFSVRPIRTLEAGANSSRRRKALRHAGVTEIAFYNYGHLRRENLASIADALAVFGS
jgi:hypothetical protein